MKRATQWCPLRYAFIRTRASTPDERTLSLPAVWHSSIIIIMAPPLWIPVCAPSPALSLASLQPRCTWCYQAIHLWHSTSCPAAHRHTHSSAITHPSHSPHPVHASHPNSKVVLVFYCHWIVILVKTLKWKLPSQGHIYLRRHPTRNKWNQVIWHQF